ncbi:uncharacterized protein MELLADRAFT_103301 [Melampsora larici-populina 98AG31]|uniref:RING-type domain-containing protein n=1 Tax=Melampsora larici-populina (strain 98AG31 / pathotype 3-4-7) TaxID=747676 RepID=F4R9Z0_MELLP|nr:uncharacterized protein MELLADRAFT_103301 [Melampsora larici-populina 98AG31]EGG10618.1 hypothetical protein MELLADRAFT_103301 [Melampsora larici-populina 98AG31]
MNSEQLLHSTSSSASTSNLQIKDHSIKPFNTEDEYDFEELGYDYLNEVNENLLCPICTNPFVDPVMCESTDHVFCRLCLIKSLELSPTCPIDRLPLSISIIQPAPKIIIKLVDELMVTCPFKEKFQCSFLCQRYLIKSHTDSRVCELAFNSKNNKKSLETDLSFPFEFNHEDEGFQFEWNQGKIQLKVHNPNLDFITRPDQHQFYKRSYLSTSSSPLSSSPSSSSTGSPRTRSTTSNSSESTSTASSTPPNESNLISCPYQRFGCTYTCQSLEEIQTVHLCSSSLTACEFEPIEEILKSFNLLEHQNQGLKSQVLISKSKEIEFKRIIESCNLSLKKLWEKIIKLTNEGLPSRNSSSANHHMRYDPINGNRIQSKLPTQLNLNVHSDGLPIQYHQHFHALWNRIRDLEFELIRVNESGLVLHELVKNLSRLQLHTSTSNSSSGSDHHDHHPLEIQSKPKKKMLKENEIWNEKIKNSGRSFVKL